MQPLLVALDWRAIEVRVAWGCADDSLGGGTTACRDSARGLGGKAARSATAGCKDFQSRSACSRKRERKLAAGSGPTKQEVVQKAVASVASETLFAQEPGHMHRIVPVVAPQSCV